MNEKFSGKVWVLGDDIDTDIIIPTEYLLNVLLPNHMQEYSSEILLITDFSL